jgi:hypothetical protein
MMNNEEIRHEESWCPVFCPMAELEDEIEKIGRLGDEHFSRRKFIEGVRHARIILRASSGGMIS